MRSAITLSSSKGSFIFTLAAIASASVAFAQPHFTVRELPVPAGYDSVAVYQINDQGYAVGDSHSAGGNTATTWINGAPKVLGRLKNGTYSTATAINSKGVVVGDGDDGDGRPLGWVTSGGQLVNFFSNNGGNTRPVAINDKGEVGGYFIKGFDSQWVGGIWTINAKDPRKSTLVELPILPGTDPTTDSAISFAFNKSNQAAGWVANNVIGQHAAFWNNDAGHTLVDLGVFGDDWSSIANGINDLGQVVGESHPPADSRPILWQNDAAHTAVELPLIAGDNYGTASLINNAGAIIGFSAQNEPGTWNVSNSKLVLWSGGAVYQLNSLLDSSAAGWTVVSVASINNLGQLAGQAMQNGIMKAVVLTPAP